MTEKDHAIVKLFCFKWYKKRDFFKKLQCTIINNYVINVNLPLSLFINNFLKINQNYLIALDLIRFFRIQLYKY